MKCHKLLPQRVLAMEGLVRVRAMNIQSHRSCITRTGTIVGQTMRGDEATNLFLNTK